MLVNQENNELAYRILGIKEKITNFHKLRLWKTEQPPEHICGYDFKNFPLDFRLLIGAIGTGVLSSDPPEFLGYHVFSISLPYRFDHPDSELNSSAGEDVFDLDGKYKLEDVLLIGHDVDFNFYGYLVREQPYRLIRSGSDFLGIENLVSLVEFYIKVFEKTSNV